MHVMDKNEQLEVLISFCVDINSMLKINSLMDPSKSTIVSLPMINVTSLVCDMVTAKAWAFLSANVRA